MGDKSFNELTTEWNALANRILTESFPRALDVNNDAKEKELSLLVSLANTAALAESETAEESRKTEIEPILNNLSKKTESTFMRIDRCSSYRQQL